MRAFATVHVYNMHNCLHIPGNVCACACMCIHVCVCNSVHLDVHGPLNAHTHASVCVCKQWMQDRVLMLVHPGKHMKQCATLCMHVSAHHHALACVFVQAWALICMHDCVHMLMHQYVHMQVCTTLCMPMRVYQ